MSQALEEQLDYLASFLRPRKWVNLGNQFGLSLNDMAAMGVHQYAGEERVQEPSRAMRAFLQEWMRRSRNACFRELALALLKIKEIGIAQRLCDRYNLKFDVLLDEVYKGFIFQTPPPGPMTKKEFRCAHEYDPYLFFKKQHGVEPMFPYVDHGILSELQQQQVQARLMKEANDLLGAFENLVYKSVLWFKDNSSRFPVSQLMECLRSFVVYRGAGKTFSIVDAVGDFPGEGGEGGGEGGGGRGGGGGASFEEACKIFKRDGFWSWLDSELLEHVVKFFAEPTVDDGILGILKNFKDQQRLSCSSKRIVECLLPVTNLCAFNHMPIFLKLRYDVYRQKSTLQFIRENTLNGLSGILGVEPAGVQILTYLHTSRELVVTLPLVVAREVFPLTPSQEMELRDVDILSIRIGNYHYRNMAGSEIVERVSERMRRLMAPLPTTANNKPSSKRDGGGSGYLTCGYSLLQSSPSYGYHCSNCKAVDSFEEDPTDIDCRDIKTDAEREVVSSVERLFPRLDDTCLLLFAGGLVSPTVEINVRCSTCYTGSYDVIVRAFARPMFTDSVDNPTVKRFQVVVMELMPPGTKLSGHLSDAICVQSGDSSTGTITDMESDFFDLAAKKLRHVKRYTVVRRQRRRKRYQRIHQTV